MPFLYLFPSQHQQSRAKLSAVFKDEGAARAYAQRWHASYTYSELLIAGALVLAEVPLGEFKKLVKTGLVYVAFEPGPSSAGYPVPAHSSPSRAGLVKKAQARGDVYRTELALFQNTEQAGAFLIEGYSLPEGYCSVGKHSGPLLHRAF